ncbi:MAG: hypothetical protein ABSG86_01215 [Thermoguttaceae bacterium]|jgi:hypothetical protein
MLAAAPALAESGAVRATWRTYRGRRLGPYFRVVYCHRGRQKWIYVGRSAELAGQLRQLLAVLQAPAEERRQLRRLWAAARRGLATQKVAWQAELARHGLVAKGFEIRARQQYRNRTYRANRTTGTH